MFKAIKVSWIKRYSIDKIDDNWADLIDNFLSLLPENRKNVHKYGPERFNKIIKANIPVISSLFTAFKSLKYKFPTCPSTMDNSWFNQNIFYNMNFTRKQPNSPKSTFLTPTFYGIADTYHTMTVKDFYQQGKFVTNDQLNNYTNTTIINMQYNNLKNHITAHIGMNKKYDAIAKEILPQRKHTYSTTSAQFQNIKKGS